MINNQTQGRWILAQGWLPENILSQAFQELEKYPSADLCQVLVSRNLLTHAQADMARRATAPGGESYQNAPLTTHSPSSLSVPSLLASTPGSSRIVPAVSNSSVPGMTKSASHLDSGYINPNQSFRATLSKGKNADFVGRKFGHFEIIEEISRGGMGVVLKAKNASIDTMVALKLLLEEDPSDASYARFKQEAQVLARLDHPGIVRVKNFGREENIPFFAMDLIVGQDLKTVVEDQLRETDQVPDYNWTVEVMEKLADALAYCHKEKVMHRDVKPANILIEDKNDHPVLVDFGLVKLKNSESQETSGMALSLSGEVRGTPAYMAPEQADPNGDFGSVGKKTDVWGFGATLFFCLTGQEPYSGNSATNIYVALMQKDPPRVSEVNPEVPDWLDELTYQCLQRRAIRRIPISHAARVLNVGRDDASAASELLGGSRPAQARGKQVFFTLVVIFALFLGAGMWIYQSQQNALETEQNLTKLKAQVESGLKKIQKSRDKTLEKLLKSTSATASSPRLGNLNTLAETENARVQLIQNSGGPTEQTDESKQIASLRSDLTALSILCQIRNNSAFDARRAHKQLSQLPEDHGMSVPVLWARALVTWKTQKYGKASYLYRQLLAVQSEQAVFYEELAQLYVAINDRKAAQKVVQNALRHIPRAENQPGILRLLLEFGDPKKTKSYLDRLAAQSSLPKDLALLSAVKAWDLRYEESWPSLSDHLPNAGAIPPKAAMLKAAVELMRCHPSTTMEILKELSFPDDPNTHFNLLLFRSQAIEMSMNLIEAKKQYAIALGAAKAINNKAAAIKIYRKLAFITRLQKSSAEASKFLQSALQYAGNNPPPDLSSELQLFYLDEAKARVIPGTTKMRGIERKLAKVQSEADPAAARKALRSEGHAYINSIGSIVNEADRFGQSPELIKFRKAFHLYITHNHKISARFKISADDKSSLAERLRAKELWGVQPWFKGGRSRQAAIEQFNKARSASKDRLSEIWLARANWMLPVLKKVKKLKPAVNIISGLNYALYTDPFDPNAHRNYATLLEVLGNVKGAQTYIDSGIHLDPSDPDIFVKLSDNVAPKDRKRVLSWSVFCDRLSTRSLYARAGLLYLFAGSLNSGQKSPEFSRTLRELTDLVPNDRRYVERARNFYISGSPDHQNYDRRLRTLGEKGRVVLTQADKAYKDKNYAKAISCAEQSRPYLSMRAQSRATYLVALSQLRSKSTQDRQGAWFKATKALLQNPSLSDDYYAASLENDLDNAKSHRAMYQSLVKVVPVKPCTSKEWQSWALFLANRLFVFFDSKLASDRKKLRECEERLQLLLRKNPKCYSARFALGLLLTIDSRRESYRIFMDLSMAGVFELHFRTSPFLKALRALTAYQYGYDSFTILLKSARDAGFSPEKWPRLFQSAVARELLENN